MSRTTAMTFAFCLLLVVIVAEAFPGRKNEESSIAIGGAAAHGSVSAGGASGYNKKEYDAGPFGPSASSSSGFKAGGASASGGVVVVGGKKETESNRHYY